MAEALSEWQRIIQDPKFHPFKVLEIEDGQWKRVIDEKDQQLARLSSVFDEQVYKSVIAALLELEEFNPSGRYPVGYAWNVKEERIATSKEVVSDLWAALECFLGTQPPPAQSSKGSERSTRRAAEILLHMPGTSKN
ncbi:unnamed protein product [Calypogeia fissa]